MRPAVADHFSAVAGNYAAFRPTYPAGLFDWLAAMAPGHTLAWDCAAGSGQATLDLAERFQQVIATDASPAQIAAAMPHTRVEYRVAPAESSGLADAVADVVVVAQALHWFDLERFYAEARRVLVADGVLAVWTYGVMQLEHAAIDRLLQAFYAETVGPYWPPQRRLVETGYRTLAFPFKELAPPSASLQTAWTLPHLLGYLRSWSATARFVADRGFDPVMALERELEPLWGSAEQRMCWPLSVRAGRNA